MIESLVMPENLPKPSPILIRVKKIFLSTESRLTQMSRRRLILVVLALALGFVLLGVVFGVIIAPYAPTETPELNSSVADHNEPVVSYTGLVKSLKEPKDGASYVLELESGKQYLLKSLAIDVSFFKGASVTAEGILVETSDGNGEILFVNKIKIK